MKKIQIHKILQELSEKGKNVAFEDIRNLLQSLGMEELPNSPSSKIPENLYLKILEKYGVAQNLSSEVFTAPTQPAVSKEAQSHEATLEDIIIELQQQIEIEEPTVVGHIKDIRQDLQHIEEEEEEEEKSEEKQEEKTESSPRLDISIKLEDPKIVGKIELDREEKPEKKPPEEPQKLSSEEREVRPGGRGRKRYIVERKDNETHHRTTVRRPSAAKPRRSRFAQTGTSSRPTSEPKQKVPTKEKTKEKEKVLEVTEFITTQELAHLLGVSGTKLIQAAFQLGYMITLNQRLEADLIELLAEEHGYGVKFLDVKEQLLEEEAFQSEKKEHSFQPRPPVVTVMGHVDHGKTKLLDYIRKSNVAAGEAGGITQHIGAYIVTVDGDRKITFLDTPGHEAFTTLRARGAKVADIAVIVIAADEGVMPQTIEAINHAKAAGVSIIFAINKIDKPEANPHRVKQQLAELGYLVEDWGGEYLCEEISAKSGKNVNKLLEKILILGELLELKARYEGRAKGVVIESSLEKGKGAVATLIVQEGTLRVGDCLVAGEHFCKVRAMFDERGRRVESATPSMPVRVLGFDSPPDAGDTFGVFADERRAREVAAYRQRLLREQSERVKIRASLQHISEMVQEGKRVELHLIVRADTQGSVEGVLETVRKLSTEKVTINVIHSGVGGVSESDVLLASASNGIIVAFNVRPLPQAKKMAEEKGVEIKTYRVIFDLVDDLKRVIEGMTPRETQEQTIGTAEVKATFKIKGVGMVAGCFVIEGKIKRNCKVHVIRDGAIVFTGQIDSLKRYKDDVEEVVAGRECGVHIEDFNDVKVGDILECFEVVEV